ncbi:MAG: trypsin-like peptidase domain-containing protein [Bacteroidales bacterium]|nr:trypsin-like peptidase domain-containing protein [Bacteroidales bacterium]
MNGRRLSILTALCLLPVCLQAQLSSAGQPLSSKVQGVVTRCIDPYGIDLPWFDVDSVLHEDSLYANPHGPLRFAHKIPVNINPDNSGETLYLADGTKVWRVKICSRGAFSLNVIFDRFRLPAGAKVFLYTPDRTQVLGAFTSDNCPEGEDFPTSPVEGDEMMIEYQEPPGAEFPGELQIYEVNHDYRGLRSGTRFKYLNMPCLPHVSCDNTLQTASKSICLLIVNGDTYCTGVLLNNTQQDGRPYLLTASHCLNNNPNLAKRTLVFMNYENPRCMEQIRGSEEFALAGCTTRALSEEIDFALLEVDQKLPPDYRPWLAGWKLTPDSVADAPFRCIHHPYGEGKRYALEKDSIEKGDWIGQDGIKPGNHWLVRHWEEGHTWIGSSGAPLFNSRFQVIGTLTGGDSGGSTGCAEYTGGDYFSRLDQAWDFYPDPYRQLKYWLDPINSRQTEIEGYDPWSSSNTARLVHIGEEDSIESFKMADYGYLLGHNKDYMSYFAERFRTDSNMLLHGVYLMPVLGNGSQTVLVQILDGDHPENILAEKILRISSTEYRNRRFNQVEKGVFSGKENYLRLDTALAVGNHWMVACRLFYPEQGTAAQTDTFALYGSATARNHAWFYDEEWLPFTRLSAYPTAMSIWMEPVVSISRNSVAPTLRPITKIRTAYSTDTRLFYFQLPTDWHRTVNIEILDINGKCVYRQTNYATQSPFSVPSYLQRGLYLIRIRDAYHSYSQKVYF